jgi:hypothetical protein
MSSHFDVPKRAAWACLRREDYSRASGLIRAVFTLVAIICLVHKACADQPDGVQRKEAGPPIIALPLDVVEPPRNVPAAQWNSPYCAHWDDGCTDCTRAQPHGKALCQSQNDSLRKGRSSGNQACSRRAIICFKKIKDFYFSSICSIFLKDEFFQDNDGSIVSFGYPYKNNWVTQDNALTPTEEPRDDPRLLIGPAINSVSDNGYFRLDSRRRYSIRSRLYPLGVFGIRCIESYRGK